MQEESLDAMCRLDADDLVLLLFWDSIREDHRDDEAWLPGLQGRAARAAFVDQLDRDKAVSIKGPKIAPSKWFSWMMAHREWDAHIHTQALIQVLLCVSQGWSKSHLELFEPLPDIVRPASDPADVSAGVRSTPLSSSPNARSSSSSSPPAPAPAQAPSAGAGRPATS